MSEEVAYADVKITLGMVFLCLLILAVCSCSVINKRLGFSDDNILEEIAEEAVRQKTGIYVDFTPSTPEGIIDVFCFVL